MYIKLFKQGNIIKTYLLLPLLSTKAHEECKYSFNYAMSFQLLSVRSEQVKPQDSFEAPKTKFYLI